LVQDMEDMAAEFEAAADEIGEIDWEEVMDDYSEEATDIVEEETASEPTEEEGDPETAEETTGGFDSDDWNDMFE